MFENMLRNRLVNYLHILQIKWLYDIYFKSS
jgi:hypothetical protein